MTNPLMVLCIGGATLAWQALRLRRLQLSTQALMGVAVGLIVAAGAQPVSAGPIISFIETGDTVKVDSGGFKFDSVVVNGEDADITHLFANMNLVAGKGVSSVVVTELANKGQASDLITATFTFDKNFGTFMQIHFESDPTEKGKVVQGIKETGNSQDLTKYFLDSNDTPPNGMIFDGSGNGVNVLTPAGITINVTSDVDVTPEPASVTLMVTGIIGILGYRWRAGRKTSNQRI
jgi:hypothetical protein